MALETLRPAEMALRRLIYVMFKRSPVEPAIVRAAPKSGPPKTMQKRETHVSQPRSRAPAFRLEDPRPLDPTHRRRHARLLTVVCPPDPTVNAIFAAHHKAWLRSRPKPEPRHPDDCSRLVRRVLALQSALTNLPRQVRRLARWTAKREARKDPSVPTTPFRHRIKFKTNLLDPYKYVSKVDCLLEGCHELADAARLAELKVKLSAKLRADTS
jgi:hypothetical protein